MTTTIHKLRDDRKNSSSLKQDIGNDIHEVETVCEYRQENPDEYACRDDNQKQEVLAVNDALSTRDNIALELTSLDSPMNNGRSLIDVNPQPQSDELSSVVESEADTFLINNLTCRLVPKETFKISEITIPCSCMDQEASGYSIEQTKSAEYQGVYSTNSALSRAREIISSAKRLQKMFETGFCNSFCSSYECVEYDEWAHSNTEQVTTSTSRTEDSNILKATREVSNPIVKI